MALKISSKKLSLLFFYFFFALRDDNLEINFLSLFLRQLILLHLANSSFQLGIRKNVVEKLFCKKNWAMAELAKALAMERVSTRFDSPWGSKFLFNISIIVLYYN